MELTEANSLPVPSKSLNTRIDGNVRASRRRYRPSTCNFLVCAKSVSFNMKSSAIVLWASLVLLSSNTLAGFLGTVSTRKDNLLSECSSCRRNTQCKQGKCWGRPSRCTDGNLPSLKRCFKAECKRCRSGFECATKKCWEKKCVFNTIRSMQKCFPNIVFKKRECDKCKEGSDCGNEKCWGGKCTDGSKRSLRKCFAPECFPCKKNTECSTKKCWNRRCVFDNEKSVRRCFK